ncbi:MAG: ABC transporter ATP-binding protein [Elusimicrobia bacterium]|nr:ABC transporter ATP-binding protein [Elusimicrobiota bacterium]
MAFLAVELRNITKTFPGVIANNNINLGVKDGEIHAIVGENGAGKSTLMNILYGLEHQDKGNIVIRGKKVRMENPHVAISHGIGMVHQHFMLVRRFTVAENIVLGREPRRGPFTDIRKGLEKIREISDRYGFGIPAGEITGNLPVGMLQRAEIVKVLYRGAKILILDEPTAVLTPQEVKELFLILRNLKEQGHTVIFITHKLKEVMEIADRVTVMRKGAVAGVRQTGETDESELSRMMIGRTVYLETGRKKAEKKETLLELRGVSLEDEKGVKALDNVSLELSSGEILGIAGVEGNGQNDLLEAVWGLKKTSSGKIYLMGRDITRLEPARARREGMSYIPADRQRHGLVLEYSVAFNMALGRQADRSFSHGIWKMNFTGMREKSRQMISEYNIVPGNPGAPAYSLSGGNQQKIVVAREIDRNPSVLLAAHPTRGVDIGVVEIIYKKLLEERAKGKGIILVSSELSEILALSDRILVMFSGRITGETSPDKTCEEELGMMMTGSISMQERQ